MPLEERRATWTAFCCWVEGQEVPVLDLLLWLAGWPGATRSGLPLPLTGRPGDTRLVGAEVQEGPPSPPI